MNAYESIHPWATERNYTAVQEYIEALIVFLKYVGDTLPGMGKVYRSARPASDRTLQGMTLHLSGLQEPTIEKLMRPAYMRLRKYCPPNSCSLQSTRTSDNGTHSEYVAEIDFPIPLTDSLSEGFFMGTKLHFEPFNMASLIRDFWPPLRK